MKQSTSGSLASAIMEIRRATTADLDAMWGIFHSVIAAGDALPFSDDFDRETFQSHWLEAQTSYVAAIGHVQILATARRLTARTPTLYALSQSGNRVTGSDER
jgi:L-amino acid N-acyltransferase YncA